MPHLVTRYETRELLVAFDRHRSACPTCGPAPSHREACEEGRRRHESMVIAARRARLRGARPWWQELDLREVRSERHLADFLGERRSHLERRGGAGAQVTIEAIDVSAWQGPFPWAEAVAVGVGLGIAKASEGVGFTDPQWGANLSALLTPGPIVPGSYHFLRPDLGDDPVAEAGWYLGRHPAACFDPAVPWVFSLDAESAGGSAAGCYAFLDAVSSRTGYSSWFYSFANWITGRGVAAYDRPLWLAWPNPGEPPLLGWPALTMVQYGSRALSVGQVDADRFMGDRSALLRLAGVAEVPAAVSSGGSMLNIKLASGQRLLAWVGTDLNLYARRAESDNALVGAPGADLTTGTALQGKCAPKLLSGCADAGYYTLNVVDRTTGQAYYAIWHDDGTAQQGWAPMTGVLVGQDLAGPGAGTTDRELRAALKAAVDPLASSPT
jgi:hypothetical protein